MNVPYVPKERALGRNDRATRVTAVLGPTNTGKTHLAIERMLAHSSGIIGLPLRLLAREVYNRAVEKVGAAHVALITGEEKIKPRHPRYWVSTIEAMPRDLDVAFVAIDEIQLGADLDRGHVFTDRLLNRRGREETLLLGAETARPLIEKLLPGVTVVTRPRLSQLMFAGEKKLSRLPRRSAIVAFSAEEVYAIAEWIRRTRGGAAVVLGALSPRTRNAQVELFQSGEVDFIIATDAIGMGLNLDVDHVAFAGDRKFDGWQYRRLNPSEMGQIAGRAGRHLRDGTFGTTGRCPPFDEDLVQILETHRFDPLTLFQWRNSDLDFSTIDALQGSLERLPDEHGLTRAPLAEDVLVLDILARDPEVRRQTKTSADIKRLWESCQVPDYRKLSPAAHSELVQTLYGFVIRAGRVPDEWFQRHLSTFDRTDGDIDALSARIAQVRTFNYISNRPDWLRDPEHWQGVTRQVEDSLSDALHERLAHRFVDRRTSVLMRRLRENAMLEAEITAAGDVLVEGQHVGQLHGFRFTPDPQAAGEAARTLNAAAQKALASEIESRAQRIHEAVDEAYVLANDGVIRWLGEAVGRIVGGDHVLSPRVRVLADDHLNGGALEQVQARLDLWLAGHVKKLLGALTELETGEALQGIGRGIAFQVAESLGVLERSRVAEEMKTLDQEGRAALRKLGIRFGAYHIYLPQLLKPAPRALAAQLWALKHGGVEGVAGADEVPHLASSGRTSFPADKAVPKGFYRAAGFRVCGERAVRVDILERLADLIRPAIAYRPGVTPGDAPVGSADGDGFVVTVAMTSLAGCSGEAFASILRSLGYVSDKRPGPAITVPLLAAAPREPVKPILADSPPSDPAPTEAREAEPVAEDASVPEVASEAAADPAPAVEPASEGAEDQVTEMPAVAAEAAAEGVDATEAPTAEAVPGETTPAETTPAETASAQATEASEPELIEVWRPHRQQQHGRRPERGQPRRDRRPQRSDQAAATSASGEPGATQTPPGDAPRSPRRDERRSNKFQTPRPEGPRAPGGRPEGRPGGGRPEGGRPRPPHGGGRRDQERDRPRGDRTFASTEKPAARDRQPDPNSPFAKLLALKAELENKGKKD
ncbi:MAG: Helicase [Hyphomicrobiales bacterium]|nr:Helicase [Hyphomicrobiales bacterium]